MSTSPQIAIAAAGPSFRRTGSRGTYFAENRASRWVFPARRVAEA